MLAFPVCFCEAELCFCLDGNFCLKDSYRNRSCLRYDEYGQSGFTRVVWAAGLPLTVLTAAFSSFPLHPESSQVQSLASSCVFVPC